MSGLRERLAEAIGRVDLGGPFPSNERKADAALATFRQWMQEEGLVCVPKSPGVVREGDWLYEAVKDASLRAAKNGRVAPQLMFAPILWAMQDALKSAPDPLGDGP